MTTQPLTLGIVDGARHGDCFSQGPIRLWWIDKSQASLANRQHKKIKFLGKSKWDAKFCRIQGSTSGTPPFILAILGC
jgi:hypothetical protein